MKYIYTLQGYESMDKKKIMYDTTEIQISADTNEEALNIAKNMIKKKYWRIARIFENPHPLEDEMKMLDFELRKKAMDKLK